jgi:hypothetical protein
MRLVKTVQQGFSLGLYIMVLQAYINKNPGSQPRGFGEKQQLLKQIYEAKTFPLHVAFYRNIILCICTRLSFLILTI